SRTRAADESVVAAEEAYRLARIGFDAGRISQLELRSTRSALIAARGTAVDARLSRVAAEIDLARLEGRAPFVEAP
ncbi:TolC family protein, partial [Acinetobacter baumannii]